jgi:hypothetical protein
MLPSGRPPEPSASSASPLTPKPLPPLPASPEGVAFTSTIRRLRRVSSSRSPPPVLRSVRPLPTLRRNAVPSAPSCHRESHVPSSWFLTTSTASSGLTARTLLQPAADPGVRRVSTTRSPAPDRSRESSQASMNASVPTTHSPREVSSCPQRLLRSPHHPRVVRHARPLPPCLFTRWHRCCARCPRASRFTVAFSPPRVRLRGLVLLTGLSPSFAVASDRQLCPSMGFYFPFSRRTLSPRGRRRVR